MLILEKSIDLFLDGFMMSELKAKYKSSTLHDFCMWLAEEYSQLGTIETYGNETIPMGHSIKPDGSYKEITYIFIRFDSGYKVRVFTDSQDFHVSSVRTRILKKELNIRLN